MRNALNALQAYCHRWELTVNPSKTKLMVVNPAKTTLPDLFIDGQKIEAVTEVTYLGIVIEKMDILKSAKMLCIFKDLRH